MNLHVLKTKKQMQNNSEDIKIIRLDHTHQVSTNDIISQILEKPNTHPF